MVTDEGLKALRLTVTFTAVDGGWVVGAIVVVGGAAVVAAAALDGVGVTAVEEGSGVAITGRVLAGLMMVGALGSDVVGWKLGWEEVTGGTVAVIAGAAVVMAWVLEGASTFVSDDVLAVLAQDRDRVREIATIIEGSNNRNFMETP
jgi:hypothetical protein